MNNKQEDFIDKKIFEIRMEIYAGIEEQLIKTKDDFRKIIQKNPELMDEDDSQGERARNRKVDTASYEVRNDASESKSNKRDISNPDVNLTNSQDASAITRKEEERESRKAPTSENPHTPDMILNKGNVVGIVDNLNNERVATLLDSDNKQKKEDWNGYNVKDCRDSDNNADEKEGKDE